MEVMRNNDRRDLALSPQRRNEIGDLRRSDGIQPRGRFIEKKEAWLQRERESDPLLHPSGNLRWHFLQVLRHADDRQKLLNPRLALGDAHFCVAAQWEFDVLSDREGIVERRLLKQETHFLPHLIQLVYREACYVLAKDADRSGVWR